MAISMDGTEMRLGISIKPANLASAGAYACAGFETAELSLTNADPTPDTAQEKMYAFAREAVANIQAAGLHLRSVHLPYASCYWNLASLDFQVRAMALEGMKTALRHASEWGAKVATLHVGIGQVPAAERAQWEACASESLHALACLARSLGMRIAVENQPAAALTNRAAALLRITDNGRLAGICFDVNHLMSQTHAAFLRLTAPWIINTHLSDYDGFDDLHAMPGTGVVPWKTVVGALVKAGYSGPLLFELRQSHPPEAVLDAFFRQIGLCESRHRQETPVSSS